MKGKWMKRSVAMLLVLAMMTSLIGCSNNLSTANTAVATLADETVNYYEVSFALPDNITEEEKSAIELPETSLVAEGTTIEELQTPDKKDGVFTGWYYDPECTEAAESADEINKNLTLYPGFGTMNGMDGVFSINYVSETDVDEDYEVTVLSYGLTQEEVEENLAVYDMTLGEEAVEFTVEKLGVEESADAEEGGSDESAGDLSEESSEDVPNLDSATLAALQEDGIDLTTATEADFREAYGLSEDESLEEFWRDSLGYEPEQILEMTELLRKNEEDRISNATQYSVKPAAGSWTAGDLHQVEILDTTNMRFLFHEEATDESVIYLNFSVYHPQVFNLTLRDGIVFIPLSEVTGVELKNGIYSVVDETTTERMDSGTLTYAGSLEEGQTLAIYDGTLNDDNTVDGDVGYYTVTGVKGGNSYDYTSANYQEIVAVPDVLPVRDDGSYDDDRITVSKAELDFSADLYSNLGLDETTTADVGDYLAFYTGSLSDESSLVSTGYGCITSITEDGDSLVITYDEAEQSQVLDCSEMYLDFDNVEIPMTQEQIDALEVSLREEAEESQFFETSGEYLAAVLSDEHYDLDNYEHADELENMTFETADGSSLTLDELQNMAGGAGKVTVSDPTISFHISTTLKHFEGSGLRGELSASFKVSIQLNSVGSTTNSLDITCTAALEQEVALGLHVAAKTDWKWYACFPVLKEITVTASFRAGTYTGLGVSCTVQTKANNNNEDKDWDELITTNNSFQKAEVDGLEKMAEGLGTLSDSLKKIQNGVSGSKQKGQDGSIGSEESTAVGAGGGLQEKYSSMLSNDADYIKILDQEVFSFELSPDPLHLVCFSLGCDLVLKLKVNAMLGFGVSYANAKQYSFSFKAIAGTSESSTADLETPNFRADFYAFGMIGIRAGVVLDARVGLVSTKMDSIGVTAEAGFYAEVYGFLYVYYTWTSGKGSDWGAQGSVLFEVGTYLTINFMAQLGGGKLSTAKTLYSKKWPLLQLGATSVPLDFSTEDGDSKLSLEFEEGKNTVQMSSDVLKMSMMALSTGKTSDAQEDTAVVDNEAYSFDINGRTYTQYNEKNFEVSCRDVDKNGNPTGSCSFIYMPASDEIYVKPADSTVDELWGQVTFTYRNHSFGFDTRSITKTVNVHWKGTAASAEVEYYLQNQDGSYSCVETGSFDGFDGIEYDIVVDEDFVNKFQGYRLSDAVFPDEAQMKDKVQAAYDEMEAAADKYQHQKTAGNYADWTKKAAAFKDLHTRLDNYGSNIAKTILDQQGTMYFMMVSSQTVVKLYFDIAPNQIYAFNMASRDDDETLVPVFSEETASLARDSKLLSNLPSLMQKYADDNPGYVMTWYYWPCDSDSGSLADAMAHKTEWTEVKENTLMPDSSIVLIGYHEPREYKVSWMDGDELVREDIVAFEAAIPQAPTVEKDGYYISGWKADSQEVKDIDVHYEAAAETMPAHDLIYTAEWTGIEQQITWMISSNGWSKTSRIATGESLLAAAPEIPSEYRKEGNKIVWYVKADGKETMLTEDMTTPPNALTVYGKYVTECKKHAWVQTDWQRATCISTGYKIYTCSVCGETKTEVLKKDPTNHQADLKEVLNSYQAPTCGKDGKNVDYYCPNCGKTVSVGSRIPATGAHNWDNGKVTREATDSATGIKTYTCRVCGAKREETIPCHVWVLDDTASTDLEVSEEFNEGLNEDAFYLNAGQTVYRCSDCGAIKTETVQLELLDPEVLYNDILSAASGMPSSTKLGDLTVKTGVGSQIMDVYDEDGSIGWTGVNVVIDCEVTFTGDSANLTLAQLDSIFDGSSGASKTVTVHVKPYYEDLTHRVLGGFNGEKLTGDIGDIKEEDATIDITDGILIGPS